MLVTNITNKVECSHPQLTFTSVHRSFTGNLQEEQLFYTFVNQVVFGNTFDRSLHLID